jgi:hypothetical protein
MTKKKIVLVAFLVAVWTFWLFQSKYDYQSILQNPQFGSMPYMKGNNYDFDVPLTISSVFEQIVAAINVLMLDDDRHLQDSTDPGVHLFLRNKPPKNSGVTTDRFRTSKPSEIRPICSSNAWTMAIKETAYVSYV